MSSRFREAPEEKESAGKSLRVGRRRAVPGVQPHPPPKGETREPRSIWQVLAAVFLLGPAAADGFVTLPLHPDPFTGSEFPLSPFFHSGWVRGREHGK
ncbi:hypothetical protein AKJ66_00140 [candidate division MSBL1 archaeon SCGC-AAA259E22]|uniref:Uncharacterized protein n=1 Tax=candidate division MSBL1 archaeon SCGC-AAA259E22 TaxID=1698265 RepID=A0A133UIH6_9EURY|nr:hypothetical protein AKJ66_00140 [candidate division MSBL1 archaeon SCGC-AAA259E22]